MMQTFASERHPYWYLITLPRKAPLQLLPGRWTLMMGERSNGSGISLGLRESSRAYRRPNTLN